MGQDPCRGIRTPTTHQIPQLPSPALTPSRRTEQKEGGNSPKLPQNKKIIYSSPDHAFEDSPEVTTVDSGDSLTSEIEVANAKSINDICSVDLNNITGKTVI